MPYSYRMTSRVLYSAQYHRQHCTLNAFEQFRTLYMHNLDKNIRPGRDPYPEFRTTTGPILQMVTYAHRYSTRYVQITRLTFERWHM